MVDYTKRPNSSVAGDGSAVNLSKVTLTENAPVISLAKQQGARGHMRVNLNWSQQPLQSGGFFKRVMAGQKAIDLDLGALWETTDGDKGVVQALGSALGRLDSPPYMQLDGDDRSGAISGGENLTINLDHLDRLKRVLIFAYIYEGVPNWGAADGVVTMYPQGAQPIEVLLDETSDRPTCAVALLTQQGGELKIEREVRYIAGSQAELDAAYSWGIRWKSGRK